MAWTAPTQRTTSTLITASIYNTDIIDNLSYLKSSINSEIQLFSWFPTVTSGATYYSIETSSNKRNYNLLTFPYNSTTYAEINCVLPADYNSSTVTYRIFWTSENASTNSVTWAMAARSFANGVTLDTAIGTYVSASDANQGNTFLNITAESSALTIGGTPTPGRWVNLRIRRTTGDTLNADALLMGAVLTYTRSTS